MNGAIRRRGLMGGDDGIFIEHPERMLINLDTTTDDFLWRVGYQLTDFLKHVWLDGEQAYYYSNADASINLNIPKAGNHNIEIEFYNINRINVLMRIPKCNILRFPYDATTKLAKLQVTPSNWNIMWGEVQLLSSDTNTTLFGGNYGYGGFIAGCETIVAQKGTIENWTNTGAYSSTFINKITEVKYKYEDDLR